MSEAPLYGVRLIRISGRNVTNLQMDEKGPFRFNNVRCTRLTGAQVPKQEWGSGVFLYFFIGTQVLSGARVLCGAQVFFLQEKQ